MSDIPPQNNDNKTPTVTKTWKASAAELAQIQQQWSKYLNGNQQYVNQGGDTYKVAYPYPGQTPANEQWRANERKFSYWEYPQRVARYYDMIRAASPEWKAPDWLDVNKVQEAYQYLKMRNNGAPTTEWKALPADDPGTQMLQGMGRPPVEFMMPTEIEMQDLVLSQDQVDAQKPFDWSQLDQPGMKWMKWYLTMFSPQSEGITGRPTSSRLAASVMQSLLPALGVGAGLGAVTANPLVGAIGIVAATGLLTYQNFTGNQIPGFNAIMRPFNWLAEGAESAIGNIALGSKVGLKEIFDDPEAAYRAGLLNYETMKMSNIPNWFAKTADLFNPMDVTTAGKDEIWKISSGNLKPVEAPHGKGAEALAYYHDWIESGNAKDEFEQALSDGTFTGRYQDFIYQKAISEYGDTAIANDIVFQTVLDPLNVMPWAVGKMGSATAGKIAKTASDPATVRMAATWSEILKQGTGNIIIDALPIGLQQLASGITKKAPSRGVLDNLNVYRDTIRNATYPKGLMGSGDDLRAQYAKLTKEGITDIQQLDNTLVWKDKNGKEQTFTGKPILKIEIPKVEDLSPLEKWIGGIDDTYGLKELRPTVGKKFLTKFFSLTPDSQVSHIMTAFHHNIATMMDAAAGDPNRMVDLIQQLAGRKTVKPGELGYDMINSPANKSVMAAMQYAFKDKDIAANMLGSWMTGAERRGILDKVAQALGEKPADILQQLQDNPDVMAQRLNKIAPELKTTGKDLTDTLKVFTGDDAMPWNAEQFQANLVNTIAGKMDDFFKEKYGLKPESWIFRASNALKGVQSLVLLGFNPAYFMNNWVNNVVTRAADGIGGYMTNKQVNDFYTRFGIFPKDSGLSMYDDITGSVIRNAQEASNDVLSKAQKTITFLNKAGVFSRLSHKIEKLEGGQARVIAMNQYLDKTKKVGVGIRKLDPAIEVMLDSKYPGLKERVYNAVNAGLNMKEIESSLFSTEIRPQIENIIDEIEQKYPGARDTLRKTNITDRLRDELANVKTKEDLDTAFENVKNAWDSWVDEQTSKAIINGVDEEAKNLTNSERIPFVLQKFGDMVIDQAKRWLNGRKEWDDLYARWEELDIAGLWDTAVQKLERKQRAEWERARKFEIETHKGIIEAIGIENEHSRAYVNGIGEYHDTWNNYWKERARLYNEYYGMKRGKDQSYDEFRADKQRAWDKLQEAQEKLYDDATTKEMEIQRKMDAEFAAMYETYTGWNATGAAKWRADLWNQRKAIIEAQKSMRKRTKGMTPDERATAYKEFNPGYNEMIARMKQVEHDGAYKLMNKPVPEVKVEVPAPETAPGEPDIRPVDGILREEGRKTGFSDEQMDRLYPKQVAEAVNQRLRNEEKAKNTPIGKAKDLVSAKIRAEDIIREADDIKRRELLHQNSLYSRATVEEAFQQAFPMATKAQITVAMTLFDDIIDRIMKRNGYQPGEAARDAWYATRIGSIERGDGTVAPNALEKLDQLMSDEHTQTPEFRAWFGDSKVVDENGQPLVVYHGSGNTFDQFSFDFVRTNGTSEGVGFYFTDRFSRAKGYGNVMEVYLSIKKPITDINQKRITKAQLTKIFKELHKINEDALSNYGDVSYEGFNKVIRNAVDLEYGGASDLDIIASIGNAGIGSLETINKIVTKVTGYDGVILDWAGHDDVKSKVYVAFSPEQIKSVHNRGTFDPNDPNILHQEVKGSFKLMDDGKAIIKGFQAGDISSMVHEVAHVFRRDLPEADLDIVAQHGGLVNGAELRELESAFISGQLLPGTAEYDKYVRAEEEFARGWERYLAEGDAPTPQLKSVFRQFTDWMLNIYQRLFKKGTSVQGFENTPLNVNIDEQYGGGSLRDVFDRMLVDTPNRVTFDSLARDKFTDVQSRGRNKARFNDQELTRMAQKELIGDLFKDFASEDEARAFIDSMTDFKVLPGGKEVDDATMYDALRFIADNPDLNPWNVKEYKEARSPAKTVAYGVADHDVRYPLTHKVVELDSLIPSDNIKGDNLVANPDFTIPEIQNRITTGDTGDISNRMSWVIDTAKKLNPDELLHDARSAQIGSPVVSTDNMVASGNGHVAVLQYAIQNAPEKWAEYQRLLPEFAAQAGIPPEAYAGMKNPVLVRELDPSVDVIAFAKDTNKPAVAVMTATELALNDASNITTTMLKRLNVLENEDIYSALKETRNSKFINSFMETLTSNEKAGITTDNVINQAGIERIVNALISKVYNSADGEAMLDTFRNSVDNNIKTLQNAIMASLPQMAYVEALIKNGERAADLSLANDIAYAANKISSLRDQGMSAGEFLGQMGLFGEGEAANLTPSQKLLLTLFDQKAPKKIREALRDYAQMVERQPAIGQETTTNLVRTKEDLLNDAINGRGEPVEQQGNIFEPRPDAGTAETIQGNELARPETAGEILPAPGAEQGVPGLVEPVQAEADLGAIARSVIATQTKADYDAGNPVPLDRAQDIEIAHNEVLPEPPAVAEAKAQAETLKFDKKQQAQDYLTWVMDGEKGPRPFVSDDVLKAYQNQIDGLREYAAMKSRGTGTWEKIKPYKAVLLESPDAGSTRKIVNGMVTTSSGRQIPWFDDFTSKQKKAMGGEKFYLQQWLIDQAYAEAQARGDTWNSDQFSRMTAKDVHQADMDLLNDYLFGEEKPKFTREAETNLDRAYREGVLVEDGVEYAKQLTGMTDAEAEAMAAKLLSARKTWEIPLDEILTETANQKYRTGHLLNEAINFRKESHKIAVRQALKEGKSVPPEVLKDYPDLQPKTHAQPGIHIQKVFKFKHGDVECVANVLKDGELIAYVPATPLKDASLDENTRIIGLDPTYPDKWVYEQDGVIKSVDSRKPEMENTTPTNLTKKNIDSKWTSYSDESGQNYYELGFHNVHAGNQIAYTTYSVMYADPSQGGKMVDLGDMNNRTFNTRQEAEDFIYQHYNKKNNSVSGTEQQSLFQSGQLDMFSQTAEDLPLFSGTPMSAEDAAFRPQEQGGQMSLFGDIVPETKPTRIIEIAVKENGATSYIRLDLRKTSAIKQTLDLHKGADMTARILDANGKVVESNLDPNEIVNPRGELFQAAEPTYDWYYSQLQKVIETMPNKMTPEALRGFLNGKVKADELQWTGFEKWLGEQQGHVSKQDALDYIMENRVKVEEVIHGGEEGVKYGNYTLPGGENYRELLLTLPYNEDGVRNALNGKDVLPKDKTLYTSPHWSEKNVLAHIRFNDRIDADGKRVLFIEEIQSDWHQAGREKGYRNEYAELPQGFDVIKEQGGYSVQYQDPGGYTETIAIGVTESEARSAALAQINKKGVRGNEVPSAPFSKNWEELAIKRAIRYAAENGYDRVAWTTGKMQNARYSLADKIDHLEYGKNLETNKWIIRGDKDGNTIVNNVFPDSELENAVGVEIAKKMRNMEGERGQYHPTIDYRVIDGQNLEVEGHGMTAFYDQKIPNIIRKYIKKWGAEVGETSLSKTKSETYGTFGGTDVRVDIKEEFARIVDIRTGETLRQGETNKILKMVNNIKRTKGADTTVQSFDVTPAMRDSVMQGQALFQKANTESSEPTYDPNSPMGNVPLNGTPATEPFAQTLDEIGSDYINPILTDIQSAYKAKMGDKAFSWGDVADADRKAVRQYLNGTVTNDLADVKRAALTYGDTMRNNAMLDYSRRFGFDNYLNLIFPYQFWYTRSMMNWAKRAIDKPSWFAMYARIQQAQERMEREGMPTRLRGKVRFDQPWMPEWMGGGLWTDPLNKLFPFDQFGQPFEQYSSNQNQVMKRAESIVDEMRTSEKITSDEARQALETQSGSVWDRAVSQAELELDKSASPLSLATMMMTPALWWTVPYNIAKGTPEKISTLPITRTGQTMKELGKDTFIEPLTDLVGGIMAGPETAIRKKAGLSEFGQWGDYYIDRTLAGMAADGEISTEQARIAMIQRNGDAFAEAYRRVSQETALRTPGAAGVMALKETVKNKEGIGTVASQTLAGFLAGMFGGGLFSEGELKMRGLKPEYDNAWRKFEAGDDEAINDFFDNHPEYYARLALYDEPEERLHQFLVDSIWKKYMDLDVENRRLAREALGDEFLNSFLNKETRSYDAISDETLARWSQTLGKSEMPEQVANVQGVQIDYYDDQMVQAITTYKAEKERLFPNIYMWQEQYFALEPGAQRKAFLQQYPQLKAYWDWKDKYAEQHPEIVPYFDELKQSATSDEVTSELTSPLIRQLLTYATGGSLSGGAKSEIERIRKMYAPNMSEDEFLMLVMALVSP